MNRASNRNLSEEIQKYIISGDLYKLKHNFPRNQNRFIFNESNLNLAITYYKNNIVKWLITGDIVIKISLIKTAIKFNNQYAIKELYRKYKFVNDHDQFLALKNEGFEYATKMGNLEAIQYFVDGGCVINVLSFLLICFLHKYTDIIKWYVDVSYVIPQNMNLIMEHMGIDDNYYFNLLFYQDIKQSGNKYTVYKNFIEKNTTFIPDFSVIYNEWKEIELQTIIHCLENKNIRLLSKFYKYYKVDRESMRLIISILLRSYNFELFSDIIKSHFLDDCEDMTSHLLFELCDDKFTSGIINNKYIVSNIESCKGIINEPIIETSWKDVLLSEDNEIIIRFDDNYQFTINNLLEHWKENLNGFNHHITPEYPSNPFTQRKFTPIEIQIVCYYAVIYKVKIPFIVAFLIRHYRILENAYKYFSNNDIPSDERHVYMIRTFQFLDLKYTGGNASENLAGNWIHKSNHKINFNKFNILFAIAKTSDKVFHT